jgi:spermidine/putrescine transport system permease protein
MKRFFQAWAAGLYAFIYLPFAVMIAFSFNDSRRNVVWKGFTFKWYGSLLENHELVGSLVTSLKVGLCAAALSSVMGVLASYALARHRPFRGKDAYGALLNAPLMLPEIVLGVGLLSYFVWLKVRLGFWTIVAAHVVFCLPFVVGSVRARLMSLRSSSLEDAAMDLGASEWFAFRTITLPLAWPAIFSGALLAFTISFQDFVTSFFVGGRGVITFPVKVYSMMKFGLTPEINAIAALMLLATILILFAQAFLGKPSRTSLHG